MPLLEALLSIKEDSEYGPMNTGLGACSICLTFEGGAVGANVRACVIYKI